MATLESNRPDPDQLLEQLRQGEGHPQRGKLRIYFGAIAGVGKTYAMLAAARREHQAGRDVVVGLVETHGRSETDQLLEGLPQLPRRELAYRDHILTEFDLDVALKRAPQVLLVDELAHSNVPGSRHPKRWQDVAELLEAGIEVWSTLNVQHLESLNGTVGAITGIRVQETVPDTVLDEADEIILVDITPDELLQRLRAGKVYLPQQAERAAQNFFRKGNLVALREIALRRTAEHVEEDVRSWRVQQAESTTTRGGLPAWNTSGAILACVGPGPGADQTVRAAARLAGQLNVRWHAAYVESSRLRHMPLAERDQVLAVLRLAEELGASTAVLTGEDAARTLVIHAQDLNCAIVLLGRSKRRHAWDRWFNRTMLQHLADLAPSLDLVEVGIAPGTRQLSMLTQLGHEKEPAVWRSEWIGYVWAVAACLAITLLATPLSGRLELTNIVMLYLAGLMGLAYRFGRGPATVSAILNVAAFDFFFVTPRFTFAVSDAQYIVTFGVMLAVGMVIGQLTAGLRFQAQVSTSRERRAQGLFELTRELSGALLAEQVVEQGEMAVRRYFGGEALVLITDERDRLVTPLHPPGGFDASVADWCCSNAQSAGFATATLTAQTWHYVPLKAPMRVRGVLAIKPEQPRWLLIPEQKQHLDTLARQVAIALERVHYVDIAQKALVQMESERLRNAMLAAISHDVRTPLTILIGLADQLSRSQPPLAAEQADTALALSQQARALNDMVSNLLEMARLQSGTVKLRLQWESIEEVVGSALRAMRRLLPTSQVQVQLPPELPLVEFDAALIERVLVNLLENAIKYGAPPIEISAQALPDVLEVRVRDHGLGLPAVLKGKEGTLFDKFTRGQAESATPGMGLGLAICKAIVDAHEGQIEAHNAEGAGAVFIVRLPRRAPPTLPE